MPRKGQFELIGIFVEVIILVAGLLILHAVVRDLLKPHEQIAAANVAALVQAIEDTCATGAERKMEFNMPQPVAYYTDVPFARMLAGKWLLPRFQVRAQGDPKFILYWQAMLPMYGLAGWDIYFDLPRRAFAYIPDDAKIQDINGLKAFIESVKSRTGAEEVIIPNLILEEVKEKDAKVFLGSAGRWDEKFPNFYRFTKPAASELEKTSIKYRACGNGLCFKTSQGIQKIPLRCTLPIMVTGIEFGHFITGFREIDVLKTSPEDVDFNLASPCKASVVVEKTQCECQAVEYSLWEIDSNGKVMKGDSRVHCPGEDFVSDMLPGNLEPESKEFICLKVRISDFDDYCAVSSGLSTIDESDSALTIIAKATRSVYESVINHEYPCLWPGISSLCTTVG